MGLAFLLVAGFVLYWALLVGLTLRSLLYPARRTFAWCVSRGEPADPGALSPSRSFEEHQIAAPGSGGGLPCWSIPGDDPEGPAVVFAHGWGESRQAVLQRLGALLPACSVVMACDLPGHGEAPAGRTHLGADEWRVLRNAVDAVCGETEGPGGLGARVVLYGFSLGAGACLQAAAEDARVAGVIAEAPYRLPATPARNVMELKGFPYRLNLRPAIALAGLVSGVGPGWRGFDRAVVSRRVGCPVLVLHGSADEMCPIEDGRAIAAAAPEGLLVECRGAAHLDLWTHPAARTLATEAVRTFLREITAAHPAPVQ